MVKDFRFQEQETTSSTTSQSQHLLRSLFRGIAREQGLPAWVLLAFFGMLLLAWNWQLIAATCTGISVMIAIYLIQDWNWNIILWRVQKFLQSPYRHLPLSVASGAITIFLTYTILTIWSTQDNHWLASAIILQLVATLGVFVLLASQAFSQWIQRQQDSFDQLITQLTVNDDLARLIAIKQITQHIQENQLPAVQERAIADCCNLLLNRETEATMREAIFETLEALQPYMIKSSLKRSAHHVNLQINAN